MMNSQQAERCAGIAWSAFTTLTSSEIAIQETIGGTPADFEIFVIQYLTEAFLTGRPRVLPKRIDAQSGPVGEEITGDYHFDKPQNLANMTYTQALMALKDSVPSKYRLKFKQLHAAGGTPYEALTQVVGEWEKARGQFGE